MTSLKNEPAGRIRSMSEFFALAHAMELDAATRYVAMAGQLRAEGESALADLFDALAETERGHIGQIDRWAEQEAPGTDAALPWPIPDTFDSTPEEMAGTRLLTPYQALASAVRHEQRSFAFWTYVAAHAEGEVKDAAERMALEELDHVSLLRRERRKAFHAGRLEGRPAGEAPVTLAALAAVEQRLADLMESHIVSAHEPTLIPALATAAREAARRLEAVHAAGAATEFSVPALPGERSGDVGALAEYLAEAYLRLAETAQDGHVLAVAQELAKAAIYRLGTLKPKGHTDPGP